MEALRKERSILTSDEMRWETKEKVIANRKSLSEETETKELAAIRAEMKNHHLQAQRHGSEREDAGVDWSVKTIYEKRPVKFRGALFYLDCLGCARGLAAFAIPMARDDHAWF